ncbi:MAG TPA: hypothetical protein VFI65_05345 [Streptosporangiaceae bacterium]|nr:hypothetical protein [Streptosporangiaceae bacterium]
MRLRHFALAAVGTAAFAGAGLTATTPALASPHGNQTFIGGLHRTKLVASTVPRNGDVNPYGVAVVKHSQGRLQRGSVLVSNFNNKKNLQGTGSTIVQVSPSGQRTVFAKISMRGLPGRCPGGIGLTTALVIVHNWVIVGSLPTTDGMAATAKAGCLLVLDNRGQVRETFSGHGINGPWDATAITHGRQASLFVTNVLNGTVAAKGMVVHRGTVLRLGLGFRAGQLPSLQRITTVGSGFAQRTDPAALVIGPTGLGIGRHGNLFVADTGMNRITVIKNAITRTNSVGTGKVVTSGRFLNAPLGLAIAPNGSTLTVNGGNGRIVETNPGNGQQVSRFLDRSGHPPGSGALFGLAVTPNRHGVYYVDDAVNTLRLLF